jgi:hypothetical protein
MQLEKRAQTLGIGLYLARSEEAMEIEEALEVPKVSDGIETLWNNFIDLSKSLDSTKKKALNDFWVPVSPIGKAKANSNFCYRRRP